MKRRKGKKNREVRCPRAVDREVDRVDRGVTGRPPREATTRPISRYVSDGGVRSRDASRSSMRTALRGRRGASPLPDRERKLHVSGVCPDLGTFTHLDHAGAVIAHEGGNLAFVSHVEGLRRAVRGVWSAVSEGAGRRRRGGKENTLAVFCVKREKRSGATDGDARACAVGETRGRESRSNTISARGTIARGGASDDVNLGSPAEAPRSPSVSRDISKQLARTTSSPSWHDETRPAARVRGGTRSQKRALTEANDDSPVLRSRELCNGARIAAERRSVASARARLVEFLSGFIYSELAVRVVEP